MSNDLIKAKALFISHGGGPLPLLNDMYHQEMVQILREIESVIVKPKAIVVVSAHWEENKITLTGNRNPELIYDYEGFPRQSYNIEYDAPGNPELSNSIFMHLKEQNFDVELDNERGWDHGVFVPLKLLYPDAEIPIIQISLISGLDPEKHIQLGKALQNILNEDTLLIGSGFTFHNMSMVYSHFDTEKRQLNQSFENWLKTTLMDNNLSDADKANELINWENAPGARFCHPREEHLLPLHVCYGYSGKEAIKSYHFKIFDILTSAFIW